MVSEMRTLINQIASGTPVDQVAQKMKDLISKHGREMAAPGKDRADQVFTSREQDDNDYENTFSEVDAAWISGKLTDGQYHTIRETVLPDGGRKTKSDSDEGDDEDD